MCCKICDRILGLDACFDWKQFHNVLGSDPIFRCMFLTGNILHKVLRSDPMFRILFFIGNIFIICCIMSDWTLCLDACFYWKHFHNVLYNQRSDPMFRSLIWWEYYRTFPTSDFLLIWNRPIACDWSIWLYAAWMYKYAWEGCRL